MKSSADETDKWPHSTHFSTNEKTLLKIATAHGSLQVAKRLVLEGFSYILNARYPVFTHRW